MPESKAQVLVTGATGFLGLHLVRRLIELGYQVRSITRGETVDERGQSLLPPQVENIRGDVTCREDVEKAVSGCQYVFHMAGLVSYRSRDLPRQITVNVEGTRCVMQACLDAGTALSRVIHTSSIAAIGIPPVKGEFADESLTYNLQGKGLTYCDTKQAAEQVVRQYAERGLDVVMLNPGIVFGEGDTHAHHHNIFKSMSRGNILAVPSGGIPFSDINDVVDAHIAAMTLGRSGERYNLVSANLSFMDAARVFSSIYKTAPPKMLLPDGFVLLAGLFCEFLLNLGLPIAFSRQQAYLATQKIFFHSKKAEKELGFQATDFAETIKRTAPHYLSVK